MATPWPCRSHSHCHSSSPLCTADLLFDSSSASPNIGDSCYAGPDQEKFPPPPCSFSPSSSSWRALRPQYARTIPYVSVRACVRACAWCRRSMGTGLCGCQLQSALTCASNVVYCPNTSPEENLSRPLKFKAIYHPQPQPHLRPLPLCQSPSSPACLPPPPPPPHPLSLSITSNRSPPHGLELEFRRD